MAIGASPLRNFNTTYLSLLTSGTLVDLTDLESSQGLHETGSVVTTRGALQLHQLLGQLAELLGSGVVEELLNVQTLLQIGDDTIHLEDLNLVAHVLLGVVGELHTRVLTLQAVTARLPGDGGTLLNKVHGVEVLGADLLNEADLQKLDRAVGVLRRGNVRGKNLNDDVGLRLLGSNVLVEVRLPLLNVGLDILKLPATLGHITLDLPGELDAVGDIQVDGEIQQTGDTVVKKRVQTLNDHDGGRINLLRGVKGTVDVVVDGLGNALAGPQSVELLVHQIEVVLTLVQSGQTSHLATRAVVQMVVIQAHHGGLRGHQGVGLPTGGRTESTAEGSGGTIAEDAGQTAHESGLTAARVSGNADQDGLLGVHLRAGQSGIHADILSSGAKSAAADLSLRNGGSTGSGAGHEPSPGHVHQRGAGGGGGGSSDIVLGGATGSQVAQGEDTAEHSSEDTSQLQH
mmetsp:Transcript_138620/g.241068  ORF Transcript_138620/g.241068 Transcript_138620/m.241068 type:complete len:458 (+) Transcript_138620:220-1593(+)